MSDLRRVVGLAQERFSALLAEFLATGTTRAQYVRYLSMQYHLTKDVQRYFFGIAANHALKKHRKLRKFLVDFALEEESHFVLAARDIEALGERLLPEPLDVALWHAYFQRHLHDRPFLRLGAAVVLENIAGGSAAPLTKQAMSAPFLNRENTRFLVLHQHETVPHGAQVLDIVSSATLDESEKSDLDAGARAGAIMYLRMARWAVAPEFPNWEPC